MIEDHAVEDHPMLFEDPAPPIEYEQIPLGPEDFAAFEPEKDRYKEQYAVIVMCADEAEQERLYNKFKAENYEVKVVCT